MYGSPLGGPVPSGPQTADAPSTARKPHTLLVCFPVHEFNGYDRGRGTPQLAECSHCPRRPPPADRLPGQGGRGGLLGGARGRRGGAARAPRRGGGALAAAHHALTGRGALRGAGRCGGSAARLGGCGGRHRGDIGRPRLAAWPSGGLPCKRWPVRFPALPRQHRLRRVLGIPGWCISPSGFE